MREGEGKGWDGGEGLGSEWMRGKKLRDKGMEGEAKGWEMRGWEIWRCYVITDDVRWQDCR